jgi:hypothetical protein
MHHGVGVLKPKLQRENEVQTTNTAENNLSGKKKV